MLAKFAVLIGLGILFFLNPLLFVAIGLLWWGSGVLARRQGLMVDEDENQATSAPMRGRTERSTVEAAPENPPSD